MSNADITVLQIHKQNLEKASTFEEYKAAHILYVEYLIDRSEAKAAMDQAVVDFYTKLEFKGSY